MNYIYDIVLNFHSKYYEFYEWQPQDNIINIRKIPIYKVDNHTYTSLKYNQVTVDSQFISQISHRSSIYLDDNDYHNICLITNGKEVIGLSFNDQGELTKRSSTIFDEEQEIIEDTSKTPLTSIILKENTKLKPHLISRIEQDKRDYLTTYLQSINPDTQASLLKYLYYEYFEKEDTDSHHIKKVLTQTLLQDWNPKLDNLYQLTTLLNQHKQEQKN